MNFENLVFIILLGLLGTIFMFRVYLEAFPELDQKYQSEWVKKLSSKSEKPEMRTKNVNQLTFDSILNQIQGLYRSVLLETSQTASNLSQKLSEPVSMSRLKIDQSKNKDQALISMIKDCVTPMESVINHRMLDKAGNQRLPNNYIRKGNDG